VLVLATAGYTLRRRFMRGLPGKVQDWLWMHTWVGITTILLVLLHENFTYTTPATCQPGCLTDSYWAASALYALILLVLSGIVGRLLDRWQTHVIARDASANGVGIVRALEEHILELEYTVERLCAGKSEPFKQYCLQALDRGAPAQPPALPPAEHADFQRASETLEQHASLVRSLHRQRRARLILRTWRTLHMILATLAVIVILYHGTMELLTNVFHILQPM
jgi:cytochrome b561